jgi:hypothetical protein
MIPPSALVIGCSEQLPNELRAYRFIGQSTERAVLLSRHGAPYSAAANEVCEHPRLLERMLGLVLAGLPASLRERARPALINRWNRDWGVEAEDLVQTQELVAANDLDLQGAAAANDNASNFAARTVATSASPFEPSRPTIQGDGSFEPAATLSARAQSCAHG